MKKFDEFEKSILINESEISFINEGMKTLYKETDKPITLKDAEKQFLNKEVKNIYLDQGIITKVTISQGDKWPSLTMKLNKPISGKLVKKIDIQIVKPYEITHIISMEK